jgi:hypothetical protein
MIRYLAPEPRAPVLSGVLVRDAVVDGRGQRRVRARTDRPTGPYHDGDAKNFELMILRWLSGFTRAR